jgi:hypothetical protein
MFASHETKVVGLAVAAGVGVALGRFDRYLCRRGVAGAGADVTSLLVSTVDSARSAAGLSGSTLPSAPTIASNTNKSTPELMRFLIAHP